MDSYLLILAVITQVSIPTAQLVISTGTQTNRENTEIETQVAIAEIKTSMCSTPCKYLHVF